VQAGFGVRTLQGIADHHVAEELTERGGKRGGDFGLGSGRAGVR
jgi:hypothetical protein